MTTYMALTTQNAQMSGWHIVALGTDKIEVDAQARAEIEQQNGPLVQPIGTNIYTETELRNLVIVSESQARRRFGIRDYHLDRYLSETAG